MALIDNLKSYWKLDTNSNDYVGGNHGFDTSIAYSKASGIINSGAGFDVASSSNIWFRTDVAAGTGSKSVSFWVNIGSFNVTNPYPFFWW